MEAHPPKPRRTPRQGRKELGNPSKAFHCPGQKVPHITAALSSLEEAVSHVLFLNGNGRRNVGEKVEYSLTEWTDICLCACVRVQFKSCFRRFSQLLWRLNPVFWNSDHIYYLNTTLKNHVHNFILSWTSTFLFHLFSPKDGHVQNSGRQTLFHEYWPINWVLHKRSWGLLKYALYFDLLMVYLDKNHIWYFCLNFAGTTPLICSYSVASHSYRIKSKLLNITKLPTGPYTSCLIYIDFPNRHFTCSEHF